jgi:NDP-sugar pyrophosphorylase family protein
VHRTVIALDAPFKIVDTKLCEMNSELIGIIPAAGRGTRMAGLTSELPKALIEIEGRTLIEQAIESLKAVGVSKIVVVTGYRGEMMRDFVSARDFGVKIDFAFQERQLGLAHAIACAADQITTDFVILCPDNIYSDAGDLQEAKRCFLSHRPLFLMVATVNPTHQRDRAKYFSSALRKIAPHVYQYQRIQEPPHGLAMTSTGCTFFAREGLRLLPSFDSLTHELKFEEYISRLAEAGDPLIYLLRGMRYDLSEPADVSSHTALQQQLKATTGQGVSAILMNAAGRILLQHRDDNPNIRYPGHWALFGGSIEDGEWPYTAARREILEETGYNVENLGLFREFVQNNKREFAFVGEINASLGELSLNEGQGMDFVSPQELRKLLIRPDDKQTLKAYFGEWDD